MLKSPIQMFWSGFRQYFLLFLLAFCPSCGFWPNASNSNTASNQPEVSEIRSEIPFSSREPETYQAEIVEKSEGEPERRIFIARKKGYFVTRRIDLGTLHLEAGKSFALNFAKKVYVENIIAAVPAESSGERLSDFLTTEWLNQKTEARFEKLGDENGLTKYRARFENSESLIFINESLQLPVRQEFYSLEGEDRILRFEIELQNLKFEVDESVFELPKDFRKVSLEEFKQELKKQ
jgi:hypothetical protein